jgi:hypothetical protein
MPIEVMVNMLIPLGDFGNPKPAYVSNSVALCYDGNVFVVS